MNSLSTPPSFLQNQDDDVSSDDDVVRAGIKFNYKQILKEIFSEEDITKAPTLHTISLTFDWAWRDDSNMPYLYYYHNYYFYLTFQSPI